MNGTTQLEIKVTLRNPVDSTDQLSYYIKPDNHQLAKDWIVALKEILIQNLHLEKNYCFLGWLGNPRTLEYLSNKLNEAVFTINQFNYTMSWQSNGLPPYIITEWYHPNVFRWQTEYGVYTDSTKDNIKHVKNKDLNPLLGSNCQHPVGLCPKPDVTNKLHNYFEHLQGTVEQPSLYYKYADNDTKYAIRQLNILCHEIENLILTERQGHVAPLWVRPSQITTFLNAIRYPLLKEHRQGFIHNKYNRQLGHVYMHWAQIGKTLFEVWRDEDAPKLDKTICDAITQLQYYSGEFDIEWGNDVVENTNCPWHDEEQQEFKNWLIDNNLDFNDTTLSLGYLHIGQIDLLKSFGTEDMQKIWKIMSQHLDIYSIEIDGIKNTFDYCWSDSDLQQQQITALLERNSTNE